MKKRKHPFRDQKHLAFVRTLPCTICKAGFISHHRIVQAHHLLKPYVGTRGMSMKADVRNVIPLCLHHHHLLHSKFGSEKALFENLSPCPSKFMANTLKCGDSRSLRESNCILLPKAPWRRMMLSLFIYGLVEVIP